MRNDIYAMRQDPAKKAEAAKLVAGRSVTYPARLEAGRWYTLVVETVGDEMRVIIDGKPAGYLKSSGISHATKSKIELGWAEGTAISTISRSGAPSLPRINRSRKSDR
jgi:hypothetical protein